MGRTSAIWSGNEMGRAGLLARITATPERTRSLAQAGALGERRTTQERGTEKEMHMRHRPDLEAIEEIATGVPACLALHGEEPPAPWHSLEFMVFSVGEADR